MKWVIPLVRGVTAHRDVEHHGSLVAPSATMLAVSTWTGHQLPCLNLSPLQTQQSQQWLKWAGTYGGSIVDDDDDDDCRLV